MKLNKLFIAACTLAIGFGFASCSDDDMFTKDGKDAFILGSSDLDCLKVTGKSGIVWKSRMEDNTIYIQVSPTVDPVEELDGVVAKFFISKGATVTPDPSIPQNFAQEGGVQYTVTSEDGKTSRTYTVTHGLTDITEFGNGFTRGIQQNFKFFDELGYPGDHTKIGGFADSRLYGDLNGYVAFCGHDNIVLLAHQYSNPQFGDPSLNVVDESMSLKVFKASDFSQAGNLNIGSLNISNIRAITSDWNGVLVAVVNNGGSADLYYWTSPTDSPKQLGHVNENICAAVDGSSYVQVAGDIFSQANITCNGNRNKTGDHYMIHLENGQIASTELIQSGYPSDDSNGFQMISPLKGEPKSSYVMGDVEGNGNNTLKVYANTYSGKTKVIMPNVLQNDWQQWWVGTGSNLARTGGRRPYVSAMYINGKYYSVVMLGTGWWWHNDIVEIDDLHTRVTGTSMAFSVNCAWSFGGSSDWYWDPELKEAYWVGYTDRYGMFSFRLTCYE